MSLQSTDQIADLITRIRNAVLVGKNEILVPTSKLKLAVTEVLTKNGYLSAYEVTEADYTADGYTVVVYYYITNSKYCYS